MSKRATHTAYGLVTTPATSPGSETTIVWSPFPVTCPVNRQFQQESYKQEVLFKKLFTLHLLLSCPGRDSSSAGAVDEEDFMQAFEDVPTVQVGLPAGDSGGHSLAESRLCWQGAPNNVEWNFYT